MTDPPPPVEFFVAVTPKPTGNAHEVRRSGPRCPRCKKRAHASVGRKESAKRLKRTIQLLASIYRPIQPWPGPVWMSVVFELPVPKTFLKWEREAALMGYKTPIARGSGDRDNYLKCLADALEGGFYVDDCLIDKGPLSKIYSARPGYRVSIRYLPMQPSSAAEWKAFKRTIDDTCDAIDPVVHPDDAFLL